MDEVNTKSRAFLRLEGRPDQGMRERTMGPIMRTIIVLTAIQAFHGATQQGWKLLQAEERSPTVLAEFQVAKHGDVLLVPVSLGEETLTFMVSTNTYFSVVDSEFEQLWKARQREAVASRQDGNDVPLAKVGELVVPRSHRVQFHDLSFLETVTGYKIAGVLGIDFLYPYVLEVDFDDGRLRFLKQVPENAGAPRTFQLRDNIPLPLIELNVPGLGLTPFSVHLGSILRMGLEPTSFRTLRRFHQADVVSEAQFKNELGQVSRSRIAILPELRIAGDTMAEVAVAETSSNVIGLDFLSRFRVTFDFANHQLYLAPGQLYRSPPDWNRNGLRCLRRDGEVIAELVDQGSPAEIMGMEPGDVIIEVNEVPVDEMTLWQLRKLFHRDAESVTIVARRDLELHTFTIEQRDYYQESPLAKAGRNAPFGAGIR